MIKIGDGEDGERAERRPARPVIYSPAPARLRLPPSDNQTGIR